MKVQVDKELSKALDKAKIGLMQQHNSVFISTILFSLKFSWCDEIPTACTNGIELKISPDFFRDLSHQERIFLLAHEAWHVAFAHMARATPEIKKNFMVWNMACDHYINLMLINANYTMINGGLADTKYEDQSKWSSNAIFDDLIQSGVGIGDFEIDMTYKAGDGEADQEAHEGKVLRRVEDILIKASVQAKMVGQAGSIPGSIQVALTELLNPKLHWSTILQKYMNAYAKEDYTFKRPNKRFASQGVIMPSLHSEALGKIACAVDTSCSVTDEQFNIFRNELAAIHKKLKPSEMTIIDFDTEIRNIYKLKQNDKVDTLNFTGRGGTDMRPVFEYFNNEKDKPVVLIIFSDMECSAITDDPNYPVIWIRLKGYGFNPTFGRLIDLIEE